MKILSFFAALFFSAALILTALYSVAVSPGTYERHQARLSVAQRSGFSQDELSALDREVSGYLRGKNALSEDDFTQRERMHMEDVRALVSLCQKTMLIAGGMAAMGMAVVVLRLRWRAPGVLLRGALWALGAFAGLILLVAALAAVDFTHAFTLFHKLLFTNDLWILSASSTLIRMFPEDFFRAMAGEIALRFAGMLLAALILGKGLSRYADTRG